VGWIQARGPSGGSAPKQEGNSAGHLELPDRPDLTGKLAPSRRVGDFSFGADPPGRQITAWLGPYARPNKGLDNPEAHWKLIDEQTKTLRRPNSTGRAPSVQAGETRDQDAALSARLDGHQSAGIGSGRQANLHLSGFAACEYTTGVKSTPPPGPIARFRRRSSCQ